MSITDELREWAARELAGRKMARERFDALTAIADRIDAEHENSMAGAALIAGVPMTDEHMAEHGWVRLPKDADGEYICAGDKLDGYGKTIDIVELRYGRCGWVLISSHGSAYVDTYAFSHHQHDTWERIIEDAIGEGMARQRNNDSGEYCERANPMNNDALVARCRALAGDAS